MHQKTQKGSREWLIIMSQEEYTHYLTDMVEEFFIEANAILCGMAAYTYSGEFAVHDDEVAENILGFIWTYVVYVVGSEVVWLRRYSHGPHGQMAAVTAARYQRATLVKLAVWWGNLQEMEKDARDEPLLKQALEDLDWPRNIYFREHFVGFDETLFNAVADDQYEDFVNFSKAMRLTKPVEDAHNCIRDIARHTKSNRCGRKRRFHAIAQSTILEDNDRPPKVMRTIEAADAARVELPNTLFEAINNYSFSLGGEALGGLHEQCRRFARPRCLSVAEHDLVGLGGD